MKNLIVFTLLAFSLQANASIIGAPFLPEIDSRFDSIEKVVANPVGISNNASLRKYAKGIVTIAGDVAGTYSTSITLPAKAIIIQSYIYVKTAVLPSGTTTAFQCVGANDILSAADETAVAANGIFSGVETGTAATMLYAPTGCNVKLVTAVHTATAGVFDLFVEYVVAN